MNAPIPSVDLLSRNLAFRRLYELGKRAWPEIRVPADEFASYLVQLATEDRDGDSGDASSGEDVPHHLEEHAIDLYLCCGCLLGLRPAVDALVEHYFGEVRRAVARVQTSSVSFEEATQLVLERLLVAGEGHRPKLLGYVGRGPLRAWLRVVAVRALLDIARAQRRRPMTQTDDLELALIPDDDPDPELAHLKRTYRGEFMSAFREAVEALAPRQRNLLRYHLLQQLSLEEIAAVYAVHRATVARWLSKARADLIRRTRQTLARRLDVDHDELQSIMRLLQSQLDLSLGGALDTAAAENSSTPRQRS